MSAFAKFTGIQLWNPHMKRPDATVPIRVRKELVWNIEEYDGCTAILTIDGNRWLVVESPDEVEALLGPEKEEG